MEQVFYDKNENKLGLEGVNIFFTKVRELAKTKDKIYVALSGGRSILSFYYALKENAAKLDKEFWEKMIFCFADERVVPLDDNDSNYKAAKVAFLGELIEKEFILEEQIIPIDYTSEKPHEDYNKKVKNVDIGLFGAGPDGHTCSLFPDHNSVKNPGQGFILVEDSPKPPPRRISMSRKMIERCKCCYMFFMGEEKQNAYDLFRDDNMSVCEVPCKTVRGCKESYIFTDLK